MKAAPFHYVRAENTEQALALLAEHGGEAKLIAGGQSLVPMMAMRLARPTVLVDINRISELQTINANSQQVQIGAGVSQRNIEQATELGTTLPLLRQALQWVGHLQTRNRGTVGGSLAHADPSAEIPLAALVLGATLNIKKQNQGQRRVLAHDFFLGPMMTTIGETDCLLSSEWPVWSGDGVGSCFEETAIRKGDFAMASAACQLQINESGLVTRASFGLGGVSGTPLVFPQLCSPLLGQRMTPELAQETAQAAARESDPGSDMHASAPFRRHLASVLLERALLQAAEQAKL